MNSPFQRWETAKEIAEVNVVPLADVSLVLLIILLVLSPMMTQSMLRVQAAGRSSEQALSPLDPPEISPPKPEEVVLVVALSPHGISVGGRAFSGPGDFMAYMTQELAARSDKKVFVTAHPDVLHGMVVHMLEMLKDCGASSVALVQTQEDEIPSASAESS